MAVKEKTVAHGGARRGAGAKPKGLVRQITIKVTDAEYNALKKVNKSKLLRDAIKPLLSQEN